ncbi:MAG: redoxin family protein [Planctomycetes bacterium]|nr:redoxin family protein [Planctomycetota bacterium]
MKTTTWLAFGCAFAVLLPACKALVRELVPHIERWGNGLTKREGRLEGDAQTGEWTFYFESGQRRAHGRYEKDRQVGPWTYWFENGGVEWNGAYDAEGKRTGEWTFFHADATERARGRYVADFEEGPWEFFHADGSLERAGQYDAGRMSGPWTYRYPGGKTKAEGMCHRGQRTGMWKVADETGKEGVQDYGLRAGVEIAFETWPSGKPRRAGILQNGAAVGRWTSWYENGAQRFCCTMANGKATGVFELRDAGGAVVAAGRLEDGKIVDGTLPAGVLPTLAADVAAWCADAAVAALAPDQRLALFANEMSGAVPASARQPRAPAIEQTPAVAAVVKAIETTPERIAAPMQPAFTVSQEKDTESIVLNYLEGQAPGRPSLKKYPTESSRAPKSGSGSGPRQLTELEGKEFPIGMLKSVDGGEVDVRQYRGKKKVLFVVLRGFLGEVCIYCVAQTEALARCRAELEELGIEVLVLYPGPRENEQSFAKAYELTFGKGAPPYRVFYDPDLEIVTALGIAGDLAYPTTIIVDENGVVQYAYVGKDRADRPAAKALIKKIKELKK